MGSKDRIIFRSIALMQSYWAVDTSENSSYVKIKESLLEVPESLNKIERNEDIKNLNLNDLFAIATYEKTQKILSNNEYVLVRSSNWRDKTSSVSSYSSSISGIVNFSKNWSFGSTKEAPVIETVVMKVPKENILDFSSSGVGTSYENEVIVKNSNKNELIESILLRNGEQY